MKKLFLSPTGRIGPQRFLIGVAGLLAFIVALNYIFSTFGFTIAPEDVKTLEMGRDNSDVVKAPKGTWVAMLVMWVSIIMPFVAMHIAYCVYIKRIHDIDRTAWVFTGALALEFLVILGLMLAFGGAEYVEAFSQFDRTQDIDPVIRQEIIDTYQAKMAANNHIIRPVMLIVPVALTLWLAFAKGRDSENKWGPAPAISTS